MPLRLTVFEKLIFQQGNLGPGPIVDLYGSFAARGILVALRLGLFEALARGPLQPEELARRIDVDERGVRLLLELLEALGYVGHRGSRFRNSATTTKWLLAGSPAGVADLFEFFEEMQQRWDLLEGALREGKPIRRSAEWLDSHPGSWDRYHAGLRAVAGLAAPEIVGRVRIPAGARRLLDLGGGHGCYSTAFCRRYPGLSAIVLDWAQARDVAEKTIAAAGMRERVSFLAADLWQDEYPGDCDVVLLFNLVRVFPAERSEALVRRAVAALRPGGLAVVVDHHLRPRASRFQRAIAAVIALELFNATPGRLHEPDAVARWLLAAGCSRPDTRYLRRSPGSYLLTARKNPA
ncbi:MAG: class I SAM-dependent methyltransferase [Candidatus Methylomirabilia bacterium]